MAREIIKNETIIQYLLGALPEAETERLDQLSVADDEFADALMAVEADLVDAYAAGSLATEDSERFLSHYLLTPHRRQKLDFAQALHVFGDQSTIVGSTEASNLAPAVSDSRSRFARYLGAISALTTPKLAFQWVPAALTFILLIAGGWLLIDNVRLRSRIAEAEKTRDALQQRQLARETQLDAQPANTPKPGEEIAGLPADQPISQQLSEKQKVQGQATVPVSPRESEKTSPGTSRLAVVSFVLSPPMRAAGPLQVISVPTSARRAAVHLELESIDYPSYSVALVSQSTGKDLWHGSKQHALVNGETGILQVRFDANLLNSGIYFLRVTGFTKDGNSEAIGDYPFRVSKQL
ncbi:MAG: hypothetical protein QOH96_2930 [Blastocatellia bacterium]|jgi:hypothetical protein|nr:hypothetical protein [Blastocatellia bacterium]